MKKKPKNLYPCKRMNTTKLKHYFTMQNAESEYIVDVKISQQSRMQWGSVLSPLNFWEMTVLNLQGKYILKDFIHFIFHHLLTIYQMIMTTAKSISSKTDCFISPEYKVHLQFVLFLYFSSRFVQVIKRL
jgi:hypothetical protein